MQGSHGLWGAILRDRHLLALDGQVGSGEQRAEGCCEHRVTREGVQRLAKRGRQTLNATRSTFLLAQRTGINSERGARIQAMLNPIESRCQQRAERQVRVRAVVSAPYFQ